MIEELTQRELQVLYGTAEGLTNEEIGLELHLSSATIKGYAKNLKAKLDAKNRAHAVAIAYHNGLLVPKTQG